MRRKIGRDSETPRDQAGVIASTTGADPDTRRFPSKNDTLAIVLRIIRAVGSEAMTFTLMLFSLAAALVAADARKVAAFDFFGYQGVDVEAVRRALPFREGDALESSAIPKWKAAAKKAVRDITAREATDVAFVCCKEGNWVIYLGLGASLAGTRYRPAPAGSVRLPADVMKFDAELSEIWRRSVMSADERDGRALGRNLEALRPLAGKHERALLDAATNSADRAHRAAAAFALGHGLEPSDARIGALVQAASDPDDKVRNNAVRSLIGWVEKHPRQIPAGIFIDLVRSGSWTDRNNGIMVLVKLAESRDPATLAAFRAHAVPAVKEMAAWRWEEHAGPARRILDLIE